MSHACVLIVMGIPGSGKTTLCKYFMEKTREEYEMENVDLIHICYDELMKEIKAEDYKTFRKHVLDLVEYNLKILTMEKKTIFIVDDIMYFKSMRRQYYNLCKKYRISYCQAYIKTEYITAIERTCQRLDHDIVLPETIFEIHQKLEPPNEPWERFSCEISSKSPFTTSTVATMWDMINSAMVSPIESATSLEKRTDEERSNESVHRLHRIDLILRKFISKKITELKTNDPNTNISIIGKQLSEKKKEFLTKRKFDNLDLTHPQSEELIVLLFEDFIS